MTDAIDGEAAEPRLGTWPIAGVAGALPAREAGVRADHRQTARTEFVPVLPAHTRRRAMQLRLKRILDVVLALTGLTVLSPLMIGAAVAIVATSDGPPVFWQERRGLHGRSFRMLKFRTMYTERGDRSGREQTRAGDDRVTPVGRLLRRTSIDELPQLINVIRGEMSLVGPRPHVDGMWAGGMEYAKLVPYYELRHAMRPGISGWAQANGLRGPTESVEAARARIDFDITYIQNFSIWLDLKIIWLTLKREFLTGSGV